MVDPGVHAGREKLDKLEARPTAVSVWSRRDRVEMMVGERKRGEAGNKEPKNEVEKTYLGLSSGVGGI